MSEKERNLCSDLKGGFVIIYGEPVKRLYLIPHEVGCGEDMLYLFPSSLEYVASFVEEGYVGIYDNVKDLVVKVNEGMRNNLNIALVEPSEVLSEIGWKARKVAAFLAWYLWKYSSKKRKVALWISRTSGYTSKPPFFKYIWLWATSWIEVRFIRGQLNFVIEHGGGSE